MPTMTLAKPFLPFALVLACASGAVCADTLYKCTDADGHATYTNNKGSAKSCIVISRDQPVSTIAAPRASRGSAGAPAPGDFPKVGAGEQKTRDGDRRAILDQELSTEHKNLDDAKKTLAQQEASLGSSSGANPQRAERLKPYLDTVALHERNIESLKKEIANLK
jgi:hypothetical protein